MRVIFLFIGLIGLSGFAQAAAEADLLVAYDNTHSDSVGGDANAEVLALNAVAAANLINERSGSPARMRICGYHKTWWQQNRSTLGGYVGWMSNPSDGELDDVTAAADARGADLVAFICQSSDPQFSGVAQQPGRYAAYQPNSFWGNVVAHETGGHNYGLAHEVGRADPKTIMMHNYCGGGSQGYYSNPNLRLNGVKLLGEGSCLGGAQQGGDATYNLSVIAQAVADRNTRVTVAPNLGNVVRRWRFDQPAGSAPNGTTILDSIGGSEPVTVVGAGASFGGEGITLPGGAPSSGAAYLDLPSGLTDAYTNITLEVWATPLSARNWARILDLNDGTNANYLMVASSVGTDLNTQRFESNVAGTSKLIESALPTVPGMPHHYVVTFQENGGGGGTWFHYRDGELVARLDVGYTLSSFPDTSAWLGRSAWWASDDLGHCEYAEVRLSDVAMTRDQIQANYLLGPNFVDTPAVKMTSSDPTNGWGSNSFSTEGTWSNGQSPSAGNDYETYGHTLWTPRDGASHTFAGKSLRLSGGTMLWNNWADSALTINDFKLNGAAVVNLGLYEFRTLTLGGNLTVENDSQIRAQGGEINLSADLGGTGDLLFTDNWVTLSGSNGSFTGRAVIGDGRFSRLRIDSEARLGATPVAFTADQLELNRGVLSNIGNVTIDDANRGLRIGASAGIFDVPGGSTLTLAVPVSSPSSGSGIPTAPLYPNPSVGLLIKQNTGTLVFTHPNNSATNEIVIEGGRLAVNGAGRLNNGDHYLPITNNGTLSFGTSSDQTVGGVISGSGALEKSGTGTLTLTATNTFTGGTTVDGGTLELNRGGANGTIRGMLTIHSGATVHLNAVDALGYGNPGSPVSQINIHGGTLNNHVGGNNSASADWSLTGGTMTSTGGGSFHIGYQAANTITSNASTTPSIISGNVVLRSGNSPTITVADGAAETDLLISGGIRQGDGATGIVKSGSGTLVLAGTNTYTGPTLLEAGTTRVHGSLGNTAVTVAPHATLGGNGSIGGGVTLQAGGRHALAVAVTPGAQLTRDIGGSLDLTATGDILDLTAATEPAPGDYTLVTASGGITGGIGDTILNLNGIPNGSLAVVGNSLVLTISPNSAYRIWALAQGLTDLNDGPDEDPDKDGIPNVLEFVLSGAPLASDPSKLPTASTTGTDFIFTFQRTDESETEVDLSFEHGTTLAPGAWTPIVIGENGAPSGPGVAIEENGAAPDTITVTVPRGAQVKLFGRLKAEK